MKAKKKVILILIDAMGADYFAAHRQTLPFLDGIAKDQIFIERMFPAVPGTSRPGRATMLTGSTSAINHIYANAIFDAENFRPAHYDDVRGLTITRLAREADLDVVCLGFGMMSPADSTGYIDPWWLHIPKTNIKIPASNSKNLAPLRVDQDHRISTALSGVSFSEAPENSTHADINPHLIGMASDQLMIQLAARLACSDKPPDLIVTEFSVTDIIQHYYGYDSGLTQWSYTAADMAVGSLIYELQRAKRMDDYAIIISSDHGQEKVGTAIYPEAFLQTEMWTIEGGTLTVWTDNFSEWQRIERACGDLGIEPLPGDHLPESLRKNITAFVAPRGTGFERKPALAPVSSVRGPPVVVSTHGLRVDNPMDHGVAFLVGATSEPQLVKSSSLRSIAPTIANLLGLDTSRFEERPLA